MSTLQLCGIGNSQSDTSPGMLLQFETHYQKWISTEDLKDIRESVLGSGVDVEALEYQFPCLVVK